MHGDWTRVAQFGGGGAAWQPVCGVEQRLVTVPETQSQRVADRLLATPAEQVCREEPQAQAGTGRQVLVSVSSGPQEIGRLRL